MADENAPTYADKVNGLASSLVKNDKGKLVVPEGTEVDESLLYAAKLEVRRRDTVSMSSKDKTRLKALEAENSKLASTWAEEATANLTSIQQSELQELKNTDPDAWRAKIDTYQSEATTKNKEKIATIKAEVNKETELERRARVLDEHNDTNKDFQLTDEVIDNDLPPRITKRLEDGEIDFDEFLQQAHAYLSKGKVLDKGTTKTKEPNLNKSGGTSTPSDKAIDTDIRESYKKVIF